MCLVRSACRAIAGLSRRPASRTAHATYPGRHGRRCGRGRPGHTPPAPCERRPRRKCQWCTNIPWLWYYLLLQNFQSNGFGFCFLAVTWSLAIEEQFYLFWPTIVKRLPSRFLAALCIATLVAEPIIRAIVLHYPYWRS